MPCSVNPGCLVLSDPCDGSDQQFTEAEVWTGGARAVAAGGQGALPESGAESLQAEDVCPAHVKHPDCCLLGLFLCLLV